MFNKLFLLWLLDFTNRATNQVVTVMIVVPTETNALNAKSVKSVKSVRNLVTKNLATRSLENVLHRVKKDQWILLQEKVAR